MCFMFVVFGFYGFGVCLNRGECSCNWREDDYWRDDKDVLWESLNMVWCKMINVYVLFIIKRKVLG